MVFVGYLMTGPLGADPQRTSCRAFSKQEAERHGLQPYAKSQFGKRVILPGIGTEYEEGYEVKWVSMRNIVLDEVGPTVEELTRYNQVRGCACLAQPSGACTAGPLLLGMTKA